MEIKKIHQWSVLSFDEIDSTNIKAMQMLQSENLHRFVISATIQLGGKGRHSRNWISPKGNSYSTYILAPAPNAPWNNPNDAALLGMLTAVAVGETLQEFGVPKNDIFYKWPNDILIDQHKIAGILPELCLSMKNHIKAVIVGVGVNLSSSPKGLDRKVSSVKEKYNITIETNEYLNLYLKKLSELLNIWINDGFNPILSKWSQNSHVIGEELIIKLPHKEYMAYFYRFSETGCLEVRTSYGEIQSVRAGEIFFAE